MQTVHERSEPRVLVVEADRVRRASLMEVLGDAGCVVEGVETAGDALAFFRGGGAAEAVVLDPEPPRDPRDPTGSDRCVAAVLETAPTVIYSPRPGTQRRARLLGATAVVDSVPGVIEQLGRLVRGARPLSAYRCA
jgi:DNA-binding response OmpR family regulator